MQRPDRLAMSSLSYNIKDTYVKQPIFNSDFGGQHHQKMEFKEAVSLNSVTVLRYNTSLINLIEILNFSLKAEDENG